MQMHTLCNYLCIGLLLSQESRSLQNVDRYEQCLVWGDSAVKPGASSGQTTFLDRHAQYQEGSFYPYFVQG